MPDSLQFNSVTNRPVPDCIRFNLIQKELEAMWVRQEKLPIDLADHAFSSVLCEILDKMEEYLNYEPTDAELGLDGEPPLSASERWTEAHRQHRELHS